MEIKCKQQGQRRRTKKKMTKTKKNKRPGHASSVLRSCRHPSFFSNTVHSFDFLKLRDDAGLDFYDIRCLINFIHTKAAETECQSVEAILELRESLHAVDTKLKGLVFSVTPEWKDDKFFTPFLENDPLLYSFDDDHDVEEIDAADKTMALQELLEGNGGSSSPSSLDTKAPVDSNALTYLTKVFHSPGKGMREELASSVDMPFLSDG